MKKMTALVLGLCGMGLGGIGVFRAMNDKLKKEKELDQKNDAILNVFERWMILRQNGRSVAEHLKKNGYRSVAIYGMHYLGKCLLKELQTGGVEVKYAIDRNAKAVNAGVEVMDPGDQLPVADAIIITAFFYFNEIERTLMEVTDCPVISFEDILSEMEHEA